MFPFNRHTIINCKSVASILSSCDKGIRLQKHYK
jgi:hypothetical protein